MLGGADPQTVLVEALELEELLGERPLARLAEGSLDGLGGLAGCDDICQQRHDRLLDLGEEGVVEGAVGVVLELVEPHGVGILAGILVARDADLRLDGLVEVGLEARPVVGELGLAPHAC